MSAEDQDLVNVINLTSGCSLASMIEYDDTDKDSKLSFNEFSVAMSKLYSEYFIVYKFNKNKRIIIFSRCVSGQFRQSPRSKPSSSSLG